MYLPLHKVKVPPDNMRRALRALAFCVLSFAVYLTATFFGSTIVEYYAFQLSLVALVLSVVLAVPFVALAIGILLSPIATYLWFDSPSAPVLHHWWFWAHVVFAVAIGIRLMIVAEKRYPRRDNLDRF